MIIYKKLENIQEFLDCINGGDIVFKMSFSLYDDGSSIDIEFYKLVDGKLFNFIVYFDNPHSLNPDVEVLPVVNVEFERYIPLIKVEIEFENFFTVEKVEHLFYLLGLNYNGKEFKSCKEKINNFYSDKIHDLINDKLMQAVKEGQKPPKYLRDYKIRKDWR